MFTIDNTAGLYTISFEDMLTIVRLANGVSKRLITDDELDQSIARRWPAVDGEPKISARAHGTIKLMIKTIASEVK